MPEKLVQAVQELLDPKMGPIVCPKKLVQAVQELLDPKMGPIGCPKNWYLLSIYSA
jgi:hypothetical protein